MTNPETLTLQADAPIIEEPNKGGRPSTYNEATARIICERLASGETYVEIAKTPGIPARQTLRTWRRKNPDFDAAYRAARHDQAEQFGDETLAIADDSTFDTMAGPKGVEVPNHANVQRDKLRIETRWRLMASIHASVFGDRKQHEHRGEVGHIHTVELSDRERMRRLASFMLEDQRNGVIIDVQPTSGNSSHRGCPVSDEKE